jgi:hypothetical protein
MQKPVGQSRMHLYELMQVLFDLFCIIAWTLCMLYSCDDIIPY